MQVSTLGIWPFDSEADKNLDAAVAAVAVMVKDKVWPQLTLTQKAAWSVVDVYRDPWEQFVEQYMEVARNVGAPYTSNANYYSVWEPRMRAKGWDADILAKLMTALRELNAEGKVPAYVMNPAGVKPPGDTRSAFELAVPWYLRPQGLATVALVGAGLYILLPVIVRSTVAGVKEARKK